MYAVIVTGGKQYKVQPKQTIKIELLDIEPGAPVVFEQVLLISEGEKILVGAPTVTGSKVTGTVKGHGRRKKIEIVKMKRRKHHRKQMGHRQYFTEVEIDAIQAA